MPADVLVRAPLSTDVARTPPFLQRAKLRAFFYRARTLPYAKRAFSRVGVPQLLGRPFAGRTLALEVSRSDTHRLLFLEGERFVLERRILRQLAFPGATVVDVGANIGYIALIFAKAVGPNGCVICLEPIPDNLVELRRNVELNKLSHVEILPIAAGDSNGRTAMTQGLNGVIAGPGGDLEVEIRRLDELGLAKVDLIKIDVEGFERSVLAGASAVLREHKPALFVEIHPRLVPDAGDPQAILDDLRSLGYFRFAAFRPTLSRSLVRKLCSRYLNKLALDETDDPLAWMHDAKQDGSGDPFWLIARGNQEPGGNLPRAQSGSRTEGRNGTRR